MSIDARPYLDNPFQVGARGGAGVTHLDDHIRDLIYQVLFTAPGERVNRPDFGCGIRRNVFMGNSGALAVATQFLIQGSLERWLAGIIETKSVRVTSVDERLQIEVVYVATETNEQREVSFFTAASAL